MASLGHCGSQTSQLMHSSVISRAIIFPALWFIHSDSVRQWLDKYLKTGKPVRVTGSRRVCDPLRASLPIVAPELACLFALWRLSGSSGQTGLGFFVEPAFDRWEHEFTHLSTEQGNFTDKRAGNKLVLIGRRHEQRFYVGQQVAIHAGHLKLIFEVGYGAQAAHDDAGVFLAYIILEQAAKALDRDIRIVTQNCFGNLQALYDRKQRILARADSDANHNMIKQPGCASNQNLVAARERIKCPWVYSSDHHELRLLPIDAGKEAENRPER